MLGTNANSVIHFVFCHLYEIRLGGSSLIVSKSENNSVQLAALLASPQIPLPRLLPSVLRRAVILDAAPLIASNRRGRCWNLDRPR
jgi:hypothetical protein